MHPFSDAAIVAAYNTRQARILEGHTSVSIAIEAARGVLAAAGLDRACVDGVVGANSGEVIYDLGLGPVWQSHNSSGIPAVLDGVAAITAGLCTTVLVVAGGAGSYQERGSTAPWTRPSNEFVVSVGMYTAVEFALIARRHMEIYGTLPEQMARVASTIRNNGHVNPDAVYNGRGPFTDEDILQSRMVADPFRLLDCSMTSEGGTALLLTSPSRAKDSPLPPVYLLGAGIDHVGPSYQHPPSWDLRAWNDGIPNGYVGRRAARRAFAMAGLEPADVDVCEFYDPFSFEIIRQLEAFGFCGDGEGGAYVMEGHINPNGRHPVTTDGGLLSFSHGGGSVQLVQRVVRAVHQLQGICSSLQLDGVEVAMCSNGGAGALFTDVLLLGQERP